MVKKDKINMKVDYDSKSMSKKNDVRINIEGDKVIAVHTLLTSILMDDNEFQIHNCPTALDFLNILFEMVVSEWISVDLVCNRNLKIQRSDKNPQDIRNLNNVSRASIGLISALAHINGQAIFSFPGGDRFCERPIDLHLKALSKVADYKFDENSKCYFSNRKKEKEEVIHINCYADSSKSIGAFFNAISLAYTFIGKIEIDGVSKDPTTGFLIDILERSTNRRVLIQENKVIIAPVDEIIFNNVEVNLPPDMSMLTTYVLLCWDDLEKMVFDNVSIKDIPTQYVDFFNNLGIEMQEVGSASIRMVRVKEINKNYFRFIKVGAYPDLSTDVGPVVSEFMAYLNLNSIIYDTVFSQRYSHIEELSKFGLQFELLNGGAYEVVAKSNPKDEMNLESKDIRAGVSLILAINHFQLKKAKISNVNQLLRGYGNIKEVLSRLGYKVNYYE